MDEELLRAITWKQFLADYYRKELEKYPQIMRGNLKLVVNNADVPRKGRKVCPTTKKK